MSSTTVVSRSSSRAPKRPRTTAPTVRRGGKKMGSLRSMTTAQLKREYTLANFPIKQSTRVKIIVFNTTGWAGTSISLTWAFSLAGAHYSIGGGTFTTATFDNTAYLTPLFDEWRLVRVENTLSTGFESFDPVGNRNMISVYSAIDTNDGDIHNLNDLWGYSTVRKHTLGLNGREYKRVLLSPGTQGAIETTTLGFTSAARKMVSPWLSCDSNNVAHYGMKYCVDTNSSTPWGMEVTFFIECYFQFRYTK